MLKINSIKIIIPVLILFVLVAYFISYIREGKAQTGLVSLKGWAWIGADCTDPNESNCSSFTTTSPIGWVSFSSDNPEITCKNVSYGVSINTSTGEISGSAWIGVGEDTTTTDCNNLEKTVGWLYFDSTDYPASLCSGDCFPAKVVDNEILGWAPIISKDDQGNQTIVTWVRFKGNNYGVNINPDGTITGYAWSGVGKEGGLGWIKFHDVTISTTTQSCVASDIQGWAWIGADCTDPNETSCGATTSPIGWISFSSDNPEITCKNISYGVSINTSTGEISGAAWIGVGENDTYTDCNTTENTVGWLDFDSTSYPTSSCSGDCFPAKVVDVGDGVHYEIQGWAPIVSKDDQGNQTIVTWVRFKGDNYGVNVNYDDGTITGYAWSGVGKEGGLGWIRFHNVTISTTTQSCEKYATLHVQSSPFGIFIDADPSEFSGTTNYSISSTEAISASLTAPTTTTNGDTFDNWQGCDSISGDDNNVCNVTVNLGETKTVTAEYTTTTQSLATLIVQSSPSGVSIIANPSQFGGTTNYFRSSTSTISASLTAPTTSNGYTFKSWQDCDSASSNVCNVSVDLGVTQTVTAEYTSITTTTFDLDVKSLDIRTFICKNKDFDTTFVDDYRSQNPNYQFFPSSTYATDFYNAVASSTCPESKRLRPVEFSATGDCNGGSCPESKLKISIESISPSTDTASTTSETSSTDSYPKSISYIYTFDKPYDYIVKACLVDEHDNSIHDLNDANNCLEKTIRIFDYFCNFGACYQAQRDTQNPTSGWEDLLYKIIQTFTEHDYPCVYYNNKHCGSHIH